MLPGVCTGVCTGTGYDYIPTIYEVSNQYRGLVHSLLPSTVPSVYSVYPKVTRQLSKFKDSAGLNWS